MNIKEITDQAVTLAGIPIDAFKARRFISEAMEILAGKYDTACLKSSATINCTSPDTEYDLPADCIGVIKVTSNNVKTNSFIADNLTIKFDAIGTYNITYLKMPKLVPRKLYDKELDEDVPPINITYHRSLPSYLAAQVLFLQNIDDPKAAKYMNDFNGIAENINIKLDRMKRKGARIKAPLWR